MKRIETQPRENWQQIAEEAGFDFHTMYGETYWDESSYYEFNLKQVEDDIEDPSTELHAMVRDAVADVIADESLMAKFGIPEQHWDYVAQSYKKDEPELYGRFDLVYDGTGPAKMLEYNGDTPTSLYEAAMYQWEWLEDVAKDKDQFNSIYEALVKRLEHIRYYMTEDLPFYFSSVGGPENVEDYATVETLAWAASDAGFRVEYVATEHIAIAENGQFMSSVNEEYIDQMFKLYPWEDMLRDDFAVYLKSSGVRMFEPPWKAIVSNKAILPVLWNKFKGHKNLLPAYFEGEEQADLGSQYVRKPIFSREGSSIDIFNNGQLEESAGDTTYNQHTKIVQKYVELPNFNGARPVIGSWIVGRDCVGMGIREDKSRITQNLSRFKPHLIA
jgi:glutathionylspermidine synthase